MINMQLGSHRPPASCCELLRAAASCRVGIHAAMLCALGRFNSGVSAQDRPCKGPHPLVARPCLQVHKAYSIFYVVPGPSSKSRQSGTLLKRWVSSGRCRSPWWASSRCAPSNSLYLRVASEIAEMKWTAGACLFSSDKLLFVMSVWHSTPHLCADGLAA